MMLSIMAHIILVLDQYCIISSGWNPLLLYQFSYKVANLIMQTECFQILLLHGKEFLRTLLMSRNWSQSYFIFQRHSPSRIMLILVQHN
nr:hypothetical protein Iba_chr04aCG19720 [Ipomoea batatas]GMC82806.1 hypothetical protein Iba_chr04bCG16840 [Ipomoea batatas]GMC84829.1 hypothetical protein Iba_chr04cCG15370 [Ipomoea batatas]GMC86918.1 hypothetical protein Iba_chr04dCG15340 [Ipomoea batatas]GMC90908.1 hypothetical protein Iba_chr04fCG12540 [Ipomoea batatas]